MKELIIEKGAKLGKYKLDILLPDALSPRKPSPSARKLPEYLSLVETLRFKEPISQWYKAEPKKENTPEIQLREALTRTLSEHAIFGYIQENSKNPQSHPRNEKSNYTIRTNNTNILRANGTLWAASDGAPRSGNWSVIPKPGSRLMIFDLDVAKKKSLADGTIVEIPKSERHIEAKESLTLLSDLLGCNLKNTYSQLSPSGGLHIFVLLPKGVDPKTLPSMKISNGMRKLAGIQKNEWNSKLKGDIRSGAANGFILMAGSTLNSSTETYKPTVTDPNWADFKDYRNGRKFQLLELPTLAVEKLQEAHKLDLDMKQNRQGVVKKKTTEKPTYSKNNTNARILESNDYKKLISRIQLDFPGSFHGARAQLYKALSCCGTTQSIADVCREAGFARDSYLNRDLTDEELFNDIEAMDRKGIRSFSCGAHCSSNGSSQNSAVSQIQEIFNTRAFSNVLEGTALEDVDVSLVVAARSELNIIRQRNSDYGMYRKREPKAFEYSKLIEAIVGSGTFRRVLSGENLFIAGVRRRALALAISYFGPLFASGNSNVIAPHSELMKLFGYTQSQVREALRLLRELKVISIAERQRTGKSATYRSGSEKFFDEILERKLRVAWSQSQVSFSSEKSFIGGFFDYTRAAIVRPDGSIFKDRYLVEKAGEIRGLLQELNLESSANMAPAYSVVARYLNKSVNRHNRIKAESTVSSLKKVEIPDSYSSDLSENSGSTYSLMDSNSLWTDTSSTNDSNRCKDSLAKTLHFPSRDPGSIPIGKDRSPPEVVLHNQKQIK